MIYKFIFSGCPIHLVWPAKLEKCEETDSCCHHCCFLLLVNFPEQFFYSTIILLKQFQKNVHYGILISASQRWYNIYYWGGWILAHSLRQVGVQSMQYPNKSANIIREHLSRIWTVCSHREKTLAALGSPWFSIFSFGATGLTLIAFLELIAVMYVYGHKRFTDDIENMTGASQGFPSSFTETLFRRAPGTVLANHVEVHLAGLDVRGDRLLHLLPPHQQPQVLRLEQRAGLLKLISEKGPTFHLFQNAGKIRGPRVHAHWPCVCRNPGHREPCSCCWRSHSSCH